MARQIETLGDLWDEAASYRDVLKADRARAPGRVRAEWLTERALLLRPSGRRHDTIHVATLLALAVSEADLVSVLAGATGRGATIIAVDSGIEIAPGGDMVVAAAAVQDWLRAKVLASEGWKTSGVQAAADQKRAETMRKIKVARPLWRDARPSRLSTAAVAETAELSIKTLYAELGRRPRIKGKGMADDDAE